MSMNVDIGDAIRANPDLLRSVTAATEYLRQLPEELSLPAVARWRYAGTGADAVELTLIDDASTWEYPSPTTATKTTRTPQIADAYGRESFVRRAWLDLLTARHGKVRTRIGQLLAQYERENPDGE